MTSLVPNQTVVKEGTFRYDAAIECDIRITNTPVRYGSGDYEDPTEIQNDVEQDIFYVEYGSITERACSALAEVAIHVSPTLWPKLSPCPISEALSVGRMMRVMLNSSFDSRRFASAAQFRH